MEYTHDLLLWSCVLLLCLLRFLLLSIRRTCNDRLPPGPVGLPILGSLLELSDKVNESLYSLSKRYGPLMTIRLGMKTVMVVSSGEMAEEILHKHDRASSGRSVGEAVRALEHDKHSVAWIATGPRWRELRRVSNLEIFSSKRLEAMCGLREKKVGELLQHVHAASVDGRSVDVGRCAFITALNIVSNTCFSKDVADLEHEVAAQGMKDLVWGIMETAGRPNLADFFPPLRLLDPQGVRRAMTGYFRRMHQLFDGMIEERLRVYAASSSVRLTNDFLDVLLQKSGEPGSEFTVDVIKSLLTHEAAGQGVVNGLNFGSSAASILGRRQRGSCTMSGGLAPGGEDTAATGVGGTAVPADNLQLGSCNGAGLTISLLHLRGRQ